MLGAVHISCAIISPTGSAAIIEQGLFNLSPMLWYPMVILVAETIVFLLGARYLTKWREK